MRLRFRKTGEVVELEPLEIFNVNGNLNLGDAWYNSIKDFVADWEDVPEEPKKYWCVNWNYAGVCENKYSADYMDEFNKSIGNYFETKEEAEKVVRRLKAWKRLKDKGFKFLGVRTEGLVIDYDIPKVLYMSPAERKELYEDLRFVFGGEE